MNEMRKLMEAVASAYEESFEEIRDRIVDDEIQVAKDEGFLDEKRLMQLRQMRTIDDPTKFIQAYKRVTGATDWDLPDELYVFGGIDEANGILPDRNGPGIEKVDEPTDGDVAEWEYMSGGISPQ